MPARAVALFSATMAADSLRYRKRFAIHEALVTLVEGIAVAAPLGVFFHFHRLTDQQRWLLVRAAPVVLGGAWLIWGLALQWWRGPMDRAVRALVRGEVVDAASRQLAAEVALALPRRAAWMRAAMSVVAAFGLGLLLTLHANFPARELVAVVAITGIHSLIVQVFRVLAWSAILEPVRSALVPDDDPLRLFHRLYRPRLVRAGLLTGALGFTATALFILFFLPPSLESFVRLETFSPLTVAPLVAVWLYCLYRLSAPIERYLAAACSADPRQHPSRDDNLGLVAYRLAQRLPYQLGGLKLLFTVFGEVLLALQATLVFHIDREYSVPAVVEAITVTIGAALYEVLWHRATLRPFLAHLAMRHRPSPDAVRTPFGLRSRMLLFLGVLTIFASTLSLLSSFVQYMTLATTSIERESELRRDRILSDFKMRASSSKRPFGATEIPALLDGEARRDSALLYYLPPGDGAVPIGFGGAREVPPALPPAERALMIRRDQGEMQIPSLRLVGSYARIYIDGARDRTDLGALAVLYPSYWGRGTAFDQQATVLLFFFVLLVIASMGIVVLIAADLTKPIRLLERHAVAMAAGDLSRPVVHVAGEVDEVGRLTFAFEAMRRALNEKLRSSTEINLSLEAEVSRRTAELERRNKELHDALDALRRAQVELLRSEKMASMGRLVAGIAHEINNPVNAVVNTVGPLEASLEEMMAEGARDQRSSALSERASDVREMIRVIRSGARRTKEIVQALHNYTRGDDDARAEVDLHRGLDESLDLLRHHLRHGITVERRYGDVGRVMGNGGQLQQVFMNLLTNAAQAIGERDPAAGGTIRITTGREQDRVVIRVSDDGPGIPEEMQARIFDPFFTTKDVGQGSGLGLSIAHGIVERHGGNISVKSHPGAGTTFTVTLPTDGGEARARDFATTPTTGKATISSPSNPGARLPS